MRELTDLEVCERVAIIKFSKENVLVKNKIVHVLESKTDTKTVYQMYFCQSNNENCKLRDELGVYINYFMETVKIYNKAFDKDDGIKLPEVSFKEKKDINKAVCLAIIKAFG